MIIEICQDLFILHLAQETTEETTIKELRSADKMLLKMMAANPVITQRELAEQTGLTEDGVYYQIKKLKEKGVLERTGATKAGRWVVLINL